MAVYIIAEAGVNHNGQLDLAYKLCDAAKVAGVDAVKFQTWKTENIVSKETDMATYQKENTGNVQESQFDMLKKLELSYSDFKRIQSYCKKIGIQFLSTPDEEESLDFLASLELPVIKVGSGEVTNIPYLRKIGAKRQHVILSTGMSYLSDVDIAYRTLINSGATQVDLLHCTTNYPCPKEEVNLRAMQTLQDAYKCRVGYSDHTEGIEIPIAAVAMGAEIIEKHFTLDKNMNGPDHKASLDPKELKEMVTSIRNIEKALGNGVKQPNASELEISKVVLKSIVAKQAISRGELFTERNMTIKRTSQGISAKHWDLICGIEATKDFEKDEIIAIN